jgi:DNA-binding GntR family transcriptional regulator
MKSTVTLTDQLRRAIEAEIVSGELSPGDRLELGALARKFSVSRTPVREALIQLSSLGFVEMKPHHEVRVARLTVQGMLDVFEVLADLESQAAELAARRMTEAERAAMLDLHASCNALAIAAQPEKYGVENLRFHEAIHKGTHNPFLVQTLHSLRNRVELYRRMRVHLRGRMTQSWREHDAVVQAIVDGDGDRARHAMRCHITMQGDWLQDFIAALPSHYFS